MRFEWNETDEKSSLNFIKTLICTHTYHQTRVHAHQHTTHKFITYKEKDRMNERERETEREGERESRRKIHRQNKKPNEHTHELS